MKYSLEYCKEIALLYKTKKEFRNNNINIYNYAYKYGFLSDICTHMTLLNSLAHRDIYVLKSENNVYVGLSCDVVRRYKQHLISGTLEVKNILNNLTSLEIKAEHIPVNEAGEVEQYWIDHYKSLGYNVVNKRQGGGLGGKPLKKYSFEELQDLAKTVKSKKEFLKKYPKQYSAAQYYKWIGDLFEHLPRLKNYEGSFTIYYRGEHISLKEYSVLKNVSMSTAYAHYKKQTNI